HLQRPGGTAVRAGAGRAALGLAGPQPAGYCWRFATHGRRIAFRPGRQNRTGARTGATARRTWDRPCLHIPAIGPRGSKLRPCAPRHAPAADAKTRHIQAPGLRVRVTMFRLLSMNSPSATLPSVVAGSHAVGAVAHLSQAGVRRAPLLALALSLLLPIGCRA